MVLNKGSTRKSCKRQFAVYGVVAKTKSMEQLQQQALTKRAFLWVEFADLPIVTNK